MVAMSVPRPRTPVAIDSVFDDPSVVADLVDAHQPYWPVQRYMANGAEYATLSGDTSPTTGMVVAPVFRGDWAFREQVADGVDRVLHHEPFLHAARTVFDAEIVRPHTVYANLTWQLPFAQGRGHVDIPAFRGFDRTTVPVAFLTIMGLSGLFETERVKVATAVAWFYDGADGGFEYWPDGPAGPSVVHEAGIGNTAIVADNDFMWHRVRPLGLVEDGMVSLDLESELRRTGDDLWSIVDGDGSTVASFERDRLRVSISWKGDVFFDDEDLRRHEQHLDDIDRAEVIRRFVADLDERGIDVVVPEEPLRDPSFLSVLQAAYMHYPT
jgi:hypothetical protein